MSGVQALINFIGKLSDLTNNSLKTSVVGSLTKDYIEAASTTTKDYTDTPMSGFDISNDGASNISVTVNGMTYTYLPGEIDSRNFATFTSLVITATDDFRCWVRG